MKINPIVKKELISLFRNDYMSKVKQVAGLIVSIMLNLLLIGFIVTLYSLLDSKVSVVTIDGVSASIPLFITLISIMVVAYTLFTMNTLSKVLYNQNDRFILRVMPLKETEIIIPKLGTMYLRILFTYSLMFLALLISFGILHYDDPNIAISWWYWPLSVVFTFVTPMIILFFAVIFSYPFHLFKQFINRHPVVQVIVSILVITALSIAYFAVIQLFADLITNNSVNTLLSVGNLQKLNAITKFLVPINYMIQVLCNQDKWLHLLVYVAFILISLGSVYFIALGYYRLYVKGDEKFSVVPKKRAKIEKFPLISKDFKLMFRNTSGSLSFIVLAVLSAIFSTFLAYLTGKLFEAYGLSSLNPGLAGNANEGILAVVSYLYFPVIVLFVTLFISIIFSSKTKLFQKEKRNVSIILTMPQTFKKQIISKMFLNLCLLFIVNLLVFILTASLRILPVLDALLLFIISLFITFSTFLMSVSHTLAVTKSLSSTSDIATTGSTNFIFSIIFPIFAFLLTAGLLVGAYYADLLSMVSPVIIYTIVAVIALLLLVLAILQFRSRLRRFSRFLSEGHIGK